MERILTSYKEYNECVDWVVNYRHSIQDIEWWTVVLILLGNSFLEINLAF